MDDKAVRMSLLSLSSKAMSLLMAIVVALGLVASFASPAKAATDDDMYIEVAPSEVVTDKHYIIAGKGSDDSTVYAIKSDSRWGYFGGREASTSDLTVSEIDGKNSVIASDSTMIWLSATADDGLTMSNDGSYLYPGSDTTIYLKSEERPLLIADDGTIAFISTYAYPGKTFYMTCSTSGALSTTDDQASATAFRYFVRADEFVPSEYTVKFVNYDGTVLSEATYPAGTEASAIDQPDKVPTKPSDDEYDYSFAGWDKPLADVTADAVYTATYDATPITKWARLAGDDRYKTMAAIGQEGFESSDYAVLVTGDNFPDALAASSIAGKYGCPVVLTKGKALSDEAADELERLGVRKVFIVGGEGSISDAVANEVNKNCAVERIAGTSRQGTSLEVLKAVAGDSLDTVVVASGVKKVKDGKETNFADALSIGPWCYASATPIVLTGNDKLLTKDQVATLKELGVKSIVVVGGDASVDKAGVAEQLGLDVDDANQVLPLAGDDRYQTSSLIATFELMKGMRMTNVAVATGATFPDALAGAALCGANNSVLILAKDTESTGLQMVDKGVGIQTGYVLGGENSVSVELFEYLENKTK